MKKIWIFGCILFLWVGCQNAAHRDTPKTENDQIIDKYTRGDDIYSGLHNTFTFQATELNRRVIDAVIATKAQFYNWEPAKTETERNKMLNDSINKSQFFVSFFTPNNTDDNLDQPAKSIWRVYLEVGGQRYEATQIKKNFRSLSELNSIYRFHSRWSTAYDIEFNVPTAQIENTRASLTITGPLGSKTVVFEP